MKHFLKIFLIVESMLWGVQLLGILSFRWAEGTVIQYPLPVAFMLLCLFVPAVYLVKVIGNNTYLNGLLLLFSPVSILSFFVIAKPSPVLWYALSLANLLLVGVAVHFALCLRKREIKRKTLEEEEFKKKAASCLNRFKSSYNKQFIVISNVVIKDVLYEMPDSCLLFELPDNRLFVLVKPPCSSDDFEFLLNDFRNEANDDWDVLGYIENGGSGVNKMIVSDICGSHQYFKKDDTSYIPFDYSILDNALLKLPTR